MEMAPCHDTQFPRCVGELRHGEDRRTQEVFPDNNELHVAGNGRLTAPYDVTGGRTHQQVDMWLPVLEEMAESAVQFITTTEHVLSMPVTDSGAGIGERLHKLFAHISCKGRTCFRPIRRFPPRWRECTARFATGMWRYAFNCSHRQV